MPNDQNLEDKMFAKILVPLDGSELAAKIPPAVVSMAKAFDSQVTLFSVCTAPIPDLEREMMETSFSKTAVEL